MMGAFICNPFMLIAQDQGTSAEQLSQKAANPLADLMSFPFQNNLNMNSGPYNRNTNVLNIQPVIPFVVGSLVLNGVTDFESIDKTWMISTGVKMEPFGIMDIIGMQTVYNIDKL